jgi:tetratricopeptide (TPR) repeat protein
MQSATDKYNQALELVKAGKYEQAKELLLSIEDSFDQPELLYKLLGSVYLLTGYPAQAVSYWQPLVDKNAGVTADQLHEAQALVPQYTDIYDRYNQALSQIQAGNEQQAIDTLKSVLSITGLPIPTEVYKAYYLLMQKQGRLHEAASFLQNAPTYVQLSPSLDHLNQRADQHVKQQKQSVRIKWAYGLVTVALIVGIAVPIWSSQSMSQLESDLKQANKNVAAKQDSIDGKVAEINEKDQKIAELNAKIQELEKEIGKPINPENPGTPGKGTEHIVKSGETLSMIAKQYYGKSIRWMDIEQATREMLIKFDPINKNGRGSSIDVGMKLIIPE